MSELVKIDDNPLSALTTKQKKFVEVYLACRDSHKAALESAYSPKSAQVEGIRLLKNRKIKRALDAMLAKTLLTRENFVTCAMTDYKESPLTSNNRPRFLELAAKGSGLIGSGESQGTVNNVTNNVQINMKVDVNKFSTNDILDKIKNLLD